MKTIRKFVGRGGRLFVVLAFGAAIVAPSLVPSAKVDALLLNNRSITMVSTQTGLTTVDAHNQAVVAGQPGNGAQTSHTFTYTHASSGATVGSIAIQYCTTPLFGTTCTVPGNMNAAAVTAVVENGYTASDFAIDTATTANTGYFSSQACSGSGVLRQNCILVRDTTPESTASTPTITLTFGQASGWIKNPETPQVFYVRITTFSDAAYTTVVDDGAVAGSVNEDIEITAKVQEKLNFSVSATTNPPSTNCATLPAGGAITLGTGGVLDANSTTGNSEHSYFRISTNASGNVGTAVKYAGDNLKTAGGSPNTIGTNVNNFTSTAGTNQFGLTLDSGDTVTGNGYSLSTLARLANYNSDTTYSFNSSSLTTPISIAQTAAGSTIGCETGSVEYVANIQTTTKPGTYKTNIMYFATPTF